VRVAASIPSVIAVGINCTPGRFVTPLLERLRGVVPIPFIVYPNAGGRWNADARAWRDGPSTDPEDLSRAAHAWLEKDVGWLGGCCGFGVEAIGALARSLTPAA
jgi:homocysteine S-methyltransferase